MNKIVLIISALFFMNFVSAQSAKEEVVATVGTKKITLDDFNKKYDQVRSRAINPPTKEQFLEELVRYELGLQEAEKRGLEKDPMVVDRMRQELYKALLEKELGSKADKITISDKEMAEHYKKNPEIRISYILIEVKPGATAEQRAEAKKRANEIYDEVKKSKRPFEELVKLYSDDPYNKQTGGDAGWQGRVTLTPTVYEALLPMKIGDIKGLIEVPFGFQILKVTGRRAYENASKSAIRTAVFNEKRLALFNDFFEKIKKGYSIKTNQKLIE